MMQSHRGAAQYRAVRSHGLVADASPTRLVQIVFEHVLAHLATAQGCVARIKDNMPLDDVMAKCAAIGKATRLIGHLNATLDMERGGQVAAQLRSLYEYILVRLTAANAHNDPKILAEATQLVRDIKTGWDGIVTDRR
jgi:flagellar protein FliS